MHRLSEVFIGRINIGWEFAFPSYSRYAYALLDIKARTK